MRTPCTHTHPDPPLHPYENWLGERRTTAHRIRSLAFSHAAVEIDYHRGGKYSHRGGNYYRRGGNDYHRGGNYSHRGGNYYRRGGNDYHRGGIIPTAVVIITTVVEITTVVIR